MKKIILVVELVLLAVYILPLRRINWGKIAWMPAETVTVTGEARSAVSNQIASFSAGVDAVDANKETAIKEVNDKLRAMIEAVKRFGISENDVKTQNLSVYQEEESYWDDGVQKSRKGQWRVSNSVEVTLREVADTSGLVDLLTSSGANNVYGPNLRLNDTSEAEKGLFDAAMDSAREKAELIAKAAERELGKVISVSEGGVSSEVYPLMYRDGMGGGGAPIEGGSTTVSKSLTVIFELK